MALKAGRVGVAPDQVDSFGKVKSEATSGYTKQEADAKFETKTDAAAALAGKQSKSLEVPIEMLSGSKLTVEDALQGLNEEKFTYADNGVLGAKNLLPFPYYETTKTVDNGTITVNTDGSVTCNGTFTNGANFELLANTNLVHDKTLLFNGCPSGGGINNKYGVQIYTTAHTSNPLNDVGNGDVSIDANDTITRIVIRIRAGQVLSNLSFYPMLRLASDPDDTYVPYAMTNRELTEKIQGIINAATEAADFSAFKTAIANL